MKKRTVVADGVNYNPMRLPCGGTAYFDEGSGYGYRCWDCMAVVGSIGQPQTCKDAAAKYDNWKKLGGKGWDYFADIEEFDKEME